MADVTFYSLPNHKGKEFEMSVGGSGDSEITNLDNEQWKDGSKSPNDNITSVKVGDDVFVRVWDGAVFNGKYETFIPGEDKSPILLSNQVSSIKIWK